MMSKGNIARVVNGLLIITFFLFASGCTSKTARIPDNDNIPEKAHLDVPLVQQRDNYSCATTSLAMVMSFYDKKIYDPKEVWKASGSSSNDVLRFGNDMFGLKKAAKAYGFTEFEFRNNISTDEIRRYIAHGVPVVVNIRDFFGNTSHAVVVIGYDKDDLYIRDPSKSFIYRKKYQYFKDNWWANLTYPKGRYKQSAFILFPDK